MCQIIVSKGEKKDERYDHLIVLIMISNHKRFEIELEKNEFCKTNKI